MVQFYITNHGHTHIHTFTQGIVTFYPNLISTVVITVYPPSMSLFPKKKETNRNQPTTPIVCVVGFSRALRVCERHKFHPNLTGRDSPRTEGYECETPLYTFRHLDRAPRGRRVFFPSGPEGTEKEQKLSPEEPVFGVSGQTLRS